MDSCYSVAFHLVPSIVLINFILFTSSLVVGKCCNKILWNKRKYTIELNHDVLPTNFDEISSSEK